MILDSFTKSLRIFLRIEKRMASSTASSDHFLYFAFGSNLLTERIHINNPSARFKCVAKLDDYKLTFNHYSKVIIFMIVYLGFLILNLRLEFV